MHFENPKPAITKITLKLFIQRCLPESTGAHRCPSRGSPDPLSTVRAARPNHNTGVGKIHWEQGSYCPWSSGVDGPPRTVSRTGSLGTPRLKKKSPIQLWQRDSANRSWQTVITLLNESKSKCIEQSFPPVFKATWMRNERWCRRCRRIQRWRKLRKWEIRKCSGGFCGLTITLGMTLS